MVSVLGTWKFPHATTCGIYARCTESFIMTITMMIFSPYLHLYLDHHCTLVEIIITLTMSMPRVYSETVMILITFFLYVKTIILVTASHYVEIVKASSHYAKTTTKTPLRFSSLLVCQDYSSA